MNNFYYYSKQIIKIFTENNELLNLISSIEKQRSVYIINPQELIDIGANSTLQVNGMNRLQASIKEKNAEILEIIRSERPNKVYDLVNNFLSELNLFDKSFNNENELVKLLKEFPEKHTDAYSEKLSNHIFSLVENSSKITQSINESKNRAEYVIDEFSKSSKKAPSDYETFRIGTDQDIPLVDDFVSIFKNLEDIYNFISYLHKIDIDSKPLILNHISTGSWYSELLGIKQVVLSLESLLKGIGLFIRDYITGKIEREQFENECIKAESFLRLMKIAEENGIKNAQLGIFKKLNPLIENFKNETTTVIEINEEEILKLRKLEKLTLLDRKNKRQQLLEKINLSIEEGKKKKPDNKKE